MPQVINTNMASLNSQRNLNASQGALTTSLQRLSSGLRINSAKDDAAGLAISERFTAQIKGLNQAARNANDGISLAQTAEGGLQTSGDILQRMRELAVQSANGTNSSSDRASLQLEVSQLKDELNRIAGTTQFNGMNVLDGSLSNTQFQVGANAYQTINVSIASSKGTDIGNYGAQSVNTSGAASSIGVAVSGTANGMTGHTLTITGNNNTEDVAITAAGTSADVIAKKINEVSDKTGVEATAMTAAKISTVAVGSHTFDLEDISGNAVTISANIDKTTDLSAMATAINAVSGKTGVMASVTKEGELTLTNKSGGDIAISNYSTTATSGGMSVAGLDAFNDNAQVGATPVALTNTVTSATVGGQINLTSSSGYTVKSSGSNNTVFNAGGTAALGSTLSNVDDLDISTVQGANKALQTIDAAMTMINNSRAALGAIQNRFASTVSNLSTTAENLSASRSRIQDTDFAAETSAMTRAQILQQAGTAMLAQANSVPNNVLSLLKS